MDLTVEGKIYINETDTQNKNHEHLVLMHEILHCIDDEMFLNMFRKKGHKDLLAFLPVFLDTLLRNDLIELKEINKGD